MAKRSRKPSAPTEWIGGTVTMPAAIAEDGVPFRPELLLWLDATNQMILGSTLEHPDELIDLAAEHLRDTIATAESGPPTRLRVASEMLAAALRAALPRLDIVVADTPEIDAIGAALVESLAGAGPEDRSWFADGLPAAAVGRFFEAMAELWESAPWDVLPGDEGAFAVTIEAFDVRDAVAVVIGQMGESFGVLLFASAADRDRFLSIGEAVQRGRLQEAAAQAGELGMPAHTALSFDPVEDVAPTLREERETHGWTLADEEAFPSLLCIGADLTERPPTTRDLALAEALARAIARVTDEDDLLEAAWAEGEAVERKLTVDTGEGPVETTLRLLVDDDEPSGDGEPPERVYRLTIELEEIGWGVPEGEISRTVDCAGDQTLWELHDVIQQAFDWDDDHLFAFYVSGKLRDRKSRYVGGPMGDVDSWEDESRSVEETCLDDLGLKSRRVMRYVFDEHIVHKITVRTVRDGGEEDVDLPRLIDAVGDAPPQYDLGEE